MAGEVKESGIAWTLCSVDAHGGGAVVIKNDVTSLSFSTTRGVQDTTGIDSAAHERLLLLPDFSISLNCVFNDNAVSAWAVFKTVCDNTVNRTTALTISGQSLDNEVAYDNVAYNRATDGSFTFVASGNLSDGTAPTWS